MDNSPVVPSADRYRAVTTTALRLGAGTTLVYAHRARSAHLLPAALADLLGRCQSFAALADHARRHCREMGLPEGEIQSVADQLATLVTAGLLLSEGDLLERCPRTAANDEAPPPIASVGLVTRDRVDTLRRALASYIENSRRHARTNDFVVVDDSERPEVRTSACAMLQALRDQYGVTILYAGRPEKERFARALVDESHVAPDIVRFALFGEASCHPSIGANRNALLLATAGDLIFSVDDDTVCRIARPPDASDALAMTSGTDPTEFRFFADRDAALRSAGVVEADCLAIQERLLGRSLASCVARLRHDGEPDFDRMTTRFFSSLESGQGRVAMTMNGLVGDSGMGSPRYYLALSGSSRARLVASEASYRSAFMSREIMRTVARPTISDVPFGLTTFIGLDNRGLLPPFFPVQRNSDGVFALTLRLGFPEAYIGFLPWALLHAPPEPRAFPSGELQRVTEGPRISDVLFACMGTHEVGAATRAESDRLRELGRYLTTLGSLAPQEFEEFLRLQLWRRAAAYTAALEGLLGVHRESPTVWANDVRHTLDVLRAALTTEDYAVPRDLRAGRTVDDARTLTRRLVLRFGQLLEGWPELVEAAKRLRANGRRLVSPV